MIKVLTYNVDGLPESLDLNDLPWILKPIAWIYKLIKGTTIVQINDNKNILSNIKQIGKFLFNSDADIISIQEDFNYHKELSEELHNKYNWGTYSGGFYPQKIFSSIEFTSHFPLLRFKADGTNILVKGNINEEEIVEWKKSFGYFSHENDLLTHKGFRFYNITINGINLDVYVIHMDADDEVNVSKDVATRRSQFEQLTNYIKLKHTTSPIIIIGDANCCDKYEWDRENVENFVDDLNNISYLYAKEAVPNNYGDYDKIFYINHENGKYELKLKECYFDSIELSDHHPLVATFDIVRRVG